MTDIPLIDARGLLCPLPVLRLRKLLADHPPGARVRLWASDAMAAVDVPHFCNAAGHPLVDQRDIGDGVREFIVEKGAVCPLGRQGGLTPEDI
ncbi:sulfurtransferase TusA family protein [uncultured Paracoccus sp.]|uniref:sulfurtransferase TusA family protein n=1 Tax=uncultured Paracoccus sp. TaxID=189685 RepID=UPI003459A4F2